jgi:predicted GNAT family acetyltransferase
MTAGGEAGAEEVVHDERAARFERRTEAGPAVLEYQREGRRIALLHTEVPEAARGGGHADALAHAALEYARAEGLEVLPRCRFVRVYLRRHPEYATLVREG